MAAQAKATKRKQFMLDAGVMHALGTLSRDSSVALDQLADEAFRDLLKKHRRPSSFHDALRGSVCDVPANDREPKRPRAKS